MCSDKTSGMICPLLHVAYYDTAVDFLYFNHSINAAWSLEVSGEGLHYIDGPARTT